MSKVINYGYTDTAISGVTSMNFPRGLVNYKSDFRVQKNGSDDVTLTNITSPVDRQEKFRFAVNEVKNIYTNSGIDPSVWAASTRGNSLLISVAETISVTDSVDPSYRVDLPVTCNITLKTPQSDLITSEYLLVLLGRAVSGAFETGSLTTDGIKRLTHGSLVPLDL